MRTAFAKTLLILAKKDKRIMLLTGDLGYSVFEEFQRECPKQYINCGVAEQNMTGVAAGLALEGYRPCIYSIIPFISMRNFEQIRNDICYQNLNVKIVGVGSGFTYGPYGHTHHALEDIGILRTISNIVIMAPGDPVEAELATKAAFSYKGPVYIRLGRNGEPVIHTKKPKFTIGRGIVIKDGTDATIIATSNMLDSAVKVAQGVMKSVRLISMPTIKPIDAELVRDSIHKTRAIVTIEEHSIIGGLGSAVAEVIAESGGGIPFQRIAVPDRFTKTIGTQEFMREANGLGIEQIVKKIENI
jgi:transketolase